VKGNGAVREVGPFREGFSQGVVGLSVDRRRGEGNDEDTVLDSDDGRSGRAWFYADLEA
jgi:hypothetical protein